MAASGCATDSSGSSEISCKENDCLTSQPTQGKDYTLISYLKANKSKFSWQGTFKQLLQFAEQHLGLTHELTKVSESETKKTIKTEQIILNWFCSTGTLQIQGSQATNCKTSILQLLNDKSETDEENASRRPSHNVGTNETSVVLVDNLETEYPSDEAVSLTVFTEEVRNIWSEIEAIRGKFVESYQLKESENESSNIQEIHTLKQKNQDLLNEICILKDQLREQNNALKSVSEERDSYRTALQILTKEINAIKEKDLSPAPSPTDPDPDHGGSSTYPNTQPNKSYLTTSDSAPQRYRRNSAISKNANHSTNLTSKSNEPHTGSTSNAQTNKPVTVIAGDSIIQNIRGWSLSKANKVVVKSFPGATTEDMEDFIKPILRKEPDNIIIHVGTNDVKAQEPRLTAEGIVNLALQIEGDAPNTNLTISGLTTRADDKEGNVSIVNKILKKFCRQNHWNFIEHDNINQTHLNRGGLHLSKSGTALLAQNFRNYID